MLALLHALDPAPVRLFAKRLPEDAEHTPVLLAAAAALQRRRPSLHVVLANTLGRAGFPVHTEPLVRAVIARSRADALLRIALVYSVASVTKMGALLCVPKDDVLTLCRQAGWKVDDGFVYIGRAAESDREGSPTGEAPSVAGVNIVGKRMNAEESLAALAEMTERLVRLQE